MAAAEVQNGTVNLFGCYDVVISEHTPTAFTCNISSVKVTEEWTEYKGASQNGAVVETLISSQRIRRLEFDLVISASSRANAILQLAAWEALKPNEVMTIASAGQVFTFEGTYNLKSGGAATLSRDGVGVVNVTMESYETTGTAGTFAALALAS